MKIPELDIRGLVKNAAARAMGLEVYVKIRKMYSDGRDLSSDEKEFQRTFNAFYKVRRDKDWRNKFYTIFEDLHRGRGEWTFRKVLEALSRPKSMTGKTFVDASFVSKMFATIDPENPIIDSFVLKAIGEKLSEGSRDEKIDFACSLYEELKKKVKECLRSDDGQKLIATFDKMFPEYRDVSSVKKLDCLMWQYGYDLSDDLNVRDKVQ